MNTNGIAKHYAQLTPEERFRLIMAASDRGDEAETERLTNAAKPVAFSKPDHAPYAHAFEDVLLMT
jgi:hypothetical protein